MDSEGIKKLADLARIDVSDAELEGLSKSIGDILAYVGSLQKAVEGSALEPQSGAVRNVMRDDVISHETGAYTDVLLAEALKSKDGYVVVKKIL